ncbi:MAG: glucose 1-dehydrogenase [Pseudorhodoplanes sp.]|jgi:threonine dehydrogenase-like Zn-dependent dehydrogenase|nr:glucose 1-dehydrogenase [Pseudorhodoplanes sp.]
MRAITLIPGVPNSAGLENVPEPDIAEGALLVRTIALGVCGTDHEILAGVHGSAPPGQQRLILGHESLGEVIDAPPETGFRPGDRVVGIVRRPDPVPCTACASGEWDMCHNGLYTERGIKERHGFGSDVFRLEPDFAVKVEPALELRAVLMEPASIVAKAWQHADRIGRRTKSWRPRNLLVTGAGPIGLLAALMGVQRGLDLHVIDRNRTGPKPELVRALGGRIHASAAEIADLSFDLVMECTAAAPLIVDAMARCAPAGIVCLFGVSTPGKKTEFDIGGLNRTLVLNNQVVFGTVNANRGHYDMAAEALSGAERSWLDRLITRRVPLTRWHEALQPRRDDIKVVIDFRE